MDERFRKLWDRKASHLKNEENLPPEVLYKERAAIYAEFGKIVCVGVGIFTRNKDQQPGLRITAFSGRDEVRILEEFRLLLNKKLDPENLFLCAHNGKEFDFPYLSRRYLINGLEIPAVLQLGGKKPWEIPHLDTMDMWRFGDRKSYTPLDLLASLFGIGSSKTDMDGSMVSKVYYEEDDIEKITHYCKQDVLVTANLYLKMVMMNAIPTDQVTFI